MSHSLPTEFAINMNLDRMMIIQQSDLGSVNSLNYFTIDSPCHIYFICRRPRVSIDKDGFFIENGYLNFKFKIQREDEFEFLEVKMPNHWYSSDLKLFTKYPYNTFEIIVNGEVEFRAKVAVFLQSIPLVQDRKFLDLSSQAKVIV